MEAQACNSQRQPMVKLTTTLVVAAATTTTTVVVAINIFRTVTAVIMAKIHLITNNCNTTDLAVARESYKTALHRTIPNIQTPRIITINNCHSTNNNNNPITTDHRPRITTNWHRPSTVTTVATAPRRAAAIRRDPMVPIWWINSWSCHLCHPVFPTIRWMVSRIW